MLRPRPKKVGGEPGERAVAMQRGREGGDAKGKGRRRLGLATGTKGRHAFRAACHPFGEAGTPLRICRVRVPLPETECANEVLGNVSRENQVVAALGQNLTERGFDPRTFGL